VLVPLIQHKQAVLASNTTRTPEAQRSMRAVDRWRLSGAGCSSKSEAKTSVCAICQPKIGEKE
jgi:hypothetical protein